MTWNPCGCVVDWSRRPFDCDARPFRGSDQLVRVRWFPAAPDAVAIPWPSNLDVPDWLRSFELPEYPGTVPAEWPGNPYNRAKAVPGSGRGHVCGTAEQFAGEAALDPDADMRYRPDGLPVCCDPVRELKGGAGGGVQASVGVVTPLTPGATCGVGSVVPLGVTVGGPLSLGPPVSNEFNWWRFSAVFGTTYRVRLHHTGDDVSFGVWSGCTFGLLGGTTLTHGVPSGCFEWTATFTGTVFVVANFLYTGFSTSATYDLTISVGHCP